MTILLVEDNFGDQKLFSMALEGTKETRLEIVDDGCKALQFLHREGNYAKSPKTDLVVLDINLPRKSGPEVLAEIKCSPDLRQLPVVMLTSAPPTDAILRICKQAILYIVKPDDGEKYFAIANALQALGGNILRCPNLVEKFAEQTRRLLVDSEGCEAYVSDHWELACG